MKRRKELCRMKSLPALGTVPHHLLNPSMNRCETESDGMNDIIFL